MIRLGKFLLACIGMILFLLMWGVLFRPGIGTQAPEFPRDEVEKVERLWENATNPFASGEPPVIQQQVDYSEGREAPWYPKGESPILAELVAEGALPPVEERTGPEPVVLQGVEGIGRYGGTWFRLANGPEDFNVMNHVLSYAQLVRWSPLGYPIVPHIAKSFEANEDKKEFVFHLRKGMRWSDGMPFTADDILYWWEKEAKVPEVNFTIPEIMKIEGKPGEVVKIDDFTVAFRFPETHGIFLELLATYKGREIANTPRHYLGKHHPLEGDSELIEKAMKARNLTQRESLYSALGLWHNPEHPRLWPWIYRTHKNDPPQSFVRNPYYYAVDPAGNQLPYIDQLLFNLASRELIGIAASNGDLSMQGRHLLFRDYTLLMDQRRANGYEVRHWSNTGGATVIFPNLNLKIDPGKPATRLKHDLLNVKEFRQALSLAINREAIIRAEFSGRAQPAQTAPPPGSPFYEPSLNSAFVEHDPERANALLDQIGLVKRDREGFRTFQDGSRMQFTLNFKPNTPADIPLAVSQDWAKVGVRAIPRERARNLFETELKGRQHDFTVWAARDNLNPLIEASNFVPIYNNHWARGWGEWYNKGGFHDETVESSPGVVEPPPGHPIREVFRFYSEAMTSATLEEQAGKFTRVLKIAAENVWTISLATPVPSLTVVQEGFHNVGHKNIAAFNYLSPANEGIETFYFENPTYSAGEKDQIKEQISKATVSVGVQKQMGDMAAGKLGTILRFLILGIVLAGLVLTGFRHPYAGRRLVIMAPTLLVISVITFIVIQAPPGDYVTSLIIKIEESGETAQRQQIEDIRRMFHMDDPQYVRYLRWLGIYWFAGFEDADKGLLQGNLGRSMATQEPVNDIVGDRLLLTFLISLGTILFTWATALPIGIYSAVRQYSPGDYVVTIIGFFGMCVPNFLLALILMYFSSRFFNINVSGLFSPAYAAQPVWTWGKFIDLMQHIWIPVVVLGTGGTAAMIRVMRGNLLDELGKPYVATARAKGVRPFKLLMKYPVRMALNPFISGIGSIFPSLVSGGAIVAVILSLPTIGPLMLQALMDEDMELAGSMLMVLSLLGVFGTLVSDLLLMLADPRIRTEGGSR